VSRLFEWSERGQRVELFTLPGIPGAILEACSEGRHGERLELPVRALVELREVITREYEGNRIDQLEHAVAAVEDERDEAIARANTLEADLRAALADLERHRTALHLADERTRQLEDALDANDLGAIR